MKIREIITAFPLIIEINIRCMVININFDIIYLESLVSDDINMLIKRGVGSWRQIKVNIRKRK